MKTLLTLFLAIVLLYITQWLFQSPYPYTAFAFVLMISAVYIIYKEKVKNKKQDEEYE